MGLRFSNTNSITLNQSPSLKMIPTTTKVRTHGINNNKRWIISKKMISSLYLCIANSNIRVHSLSQKVIRVNQSSSNRTHSLMKFLRNPCILHLKQCSSKTLMDLAPMGLNPLQRPIQVLITRAKISSMMKSVRESWRPNKNVSREHITFMKDKWKSKDWKMQDVPQGRNNYSSGLMRNRDKFNWHKRTIR